MEFFGPATQQWFGNAFAAPTEVQRLGWARIHAGEHTLLIAPTGSGKTLAAFLYALDRLAHAAPDHESTSEPGTRVVYVSPLKALVYDIERNLRAPLAGIARAAAGSSPALQLPRVDVRTGDTTLAGTPASVARARGDPGHHTRIALPAVGLAGARKPPHGALDHR